MENKVYIDPYPKTMKMLGLERINIDCGNNTSIVTPANIAKDMVALLPDEVFIPESKFLDICCKSGIFLTSIREKLMNSKAMIESFPDDKERYKYITNNQLYGIAPNGQCQMYSVRAVYGTLKVDNPHILCFGAFDQYKTACLNNNHKMLIDEMKKEFNTMKFDVVIGNPPYNKDIYLDFVTLGHTLASKYDCWISPAKWQAKGGQKNEDFRKNIVPHMKNIVYYPEETDVFDVRSACGISYYLIDKNIHKEKYIYNISNRVKAFNSGLQIREYNKLDTLYNIGNTIVKKLGNTGVNLLSNDTSKRYKVALNNQVLYWGSSKTHCFFSPDGKSQVISNCKIFDSTSDKKLEVSAAAYVFSTDNVNEVEYFKSWVDTKFIRFLVLIGFNVLTGVLNPEFWRFVPNPEAFDHIFTDEELYKKYNLTSEEINIIESVIKERK